ncbi:MAG: ATP-binding protein [Brevinema sp.]
MKVNRIIINKSGVLKNIDTFLSQANLIIGDNERGKTTFLNWIAKGLFDKPNQQQESFVTHIDNYNNVQFDIDPFYPYYDSERMKNLLFIKETDLLFKHKNQEELFKHEYWNNEINTLLYGNDEISPLLQKNFLRALGVHSKNSWLTQLHTGLFTLKNTLEDLLPELEKINSKAQGLYQLNHSLGTINQAEQGFQSKEDLYFTIDKIQIGQQYLNFLENDQQLKKQEQELQNLIAHRDSLKEELTKKDDLLLDYDDDLTQLKLTNAQLKNKEQQALYEPQELYHKSFGEIVFGACIGTAMVLAGISLAFQSMATTTVSPTKTIALVCFVIGIFFLLKTYIQGLLLQKLSQSSQEDPNYIHQVFIKKIQKEQSLNTNQLAHKQKKLLNLQEETSQIRKELKNFQIKIESTQKELRNLDLIGQELAKKSHSVFDLFQTSDPITIQQEIQECQELIEGQSHHFNYQDLQKLREEKQSLLTQKISISNTYTHSKSTVAKTIKSLIDELHNIDNRESIQHFYPEVFQLFIRSHDLSNYSELLETVEFLINKVSNDRYRAEKLTNLFYTIESNSENLLAKTLNSSFFEFLTQNIFGGKYQRFTLQTIPNEGVKIFAETGQGELYPLETLSAGTYAQFWFILRLSLAKSILKDQPGIILLDDPFNSFDTIRKRYFLDALNALAHQGWQIFLTITHDPIIQEYFSSMFQPQLQIIDLNKDNPDN